MTTFHFNTLNPHPQLSAYIAKVYVFESSGRLPVEDRKLIVPNANFKLTLTWRNGIVAHIAGRAFVQTEYQLSLTGLIDSPVMLDPMEDTLTGTIIIEFSPLGAYRFFRLSYAEIKNQIVDLQDLIGNEVKQLQAKLMDVSTPDLKLQILQQFLIKQLAKTAPDQIFDYCIDRISASKGIITATQMEKETGYSARWLQTKFSEHLGTGAKNFSEIIRFKQFYGAYSAGAKLQTLKGHIYGYYHDQSHFIRAFKRFTGCTPTQLQNSMNELSAKHYTS